MSLGNFDSLHSAIPISVSGGEQTVFPSDILPINVGVATIGSSTKYARADHIHALQTKRCVGSIANSYVPGVAGSSIEFTKNINTLTGPQNSINLAAGKTYNLTAAITHATTSIPTVVSVSDEHFDNVSFLLLPTGPVNNDYFTNIGYEDSVISTFGDVNTITSSPGSHQLPYSIILPPKTSNESSDFITNNYLRISVPSEEMWVSLSRSYTVDFYISAPIEASGGTYFVLHPNEPDHSWWYILINSAGKLELKLNSGAANSQLAEVNFATPGSIIGEGVVHYEFSFDVNTGIIRAFLNGVGIKAHTISSPVSLDFDGPPANTTHIRLASNGGFAGDPDVSIEITGLRITQDVVRHTSNFTPPQIVAEYYGAGANIGGANIIYTPTTNNFTYQWRDTTNNVDVGMPGTLTTDSSSSALAIIQPNVLTNVQLMVKKNDNLTTLDANGGTSAGLIWVEEL